ncbi:ATP-binding protein [Corynebacterium glucuronolyticum]|uniref:ATP-binding protein n=1 Tax=Corynebacterium glucuronolyticum TaxID=39791 RepID=UPI003F6E0ADC
MTLFETGDATGPVSLQNLAAGEEIRAVESSMNISALFECMCRGGWPANLGLTLAQAQANNRDYARTIAEVDIRTPDGVKRDPEKVMKVLRSLSRGLATEMSVATIAKDTGINWETVSDYLDSLQRIFISEDQLAWSQNLRSRTPLRKAPKRHLTDPALALAVLNVSPEALVKNLPFAGQVFESFVVHELRALTARPVYHARLEDGLEVDALVEMDDAILAVEIKLGHSKEVVDGAAANLLKFAKLLDGNVVPVVITGSGLSYQRLDGVNVVAIDALAR